MVREATKSCTVCRKRNPPVGTRFWSSERNAKLACAFPSRDRILRREKIRFLRNNAPDTYPVGTKKSVFCAITLLIRTKHNIKTSPCRTYQQRPTCKNRFFTSYCTVSRAWMLVGTRFWSSERNAKLACAFPSRDRILRREKIRFLRNNAPDTYQAQHKNFFLLYVPASSYV